MSNQTRNNGKSNRGCNEPPCKKQRIVEPYYDLKLDLTAGFIARSVLICQIINCTARKVRVGSFTWNLCQIYPYADPYRQRLFGPFPNLAHQSLRPVLGSIKILSPAQNERGPSFACLHAQYKMGKWDSTYYLESKKTDFEYRVKASKLDSYGRRVRNFQKCLVKVLFFLSKSKEFNRVIFPKFIGCGQAGGNWEDYEPLIKDFSLQVQSLPHSVRVFVIEKPK